MPRLWIWIIAAIIAVAAAVILGRVVSKDEPVLYEPDLTRIEAAPLCPWRDPEADMKRFFPEATGYTTETRILSGLRVELAERLGRRPEPEENALLLNRILRDTDEAGVVLTRRLKGEHGAIELVLALTGEGEVHGLRLQRIREPESITEQLNSWLPTLVGRTHRSPRKTKPAVPENALASASAIEDAVHSLLTLYECSKTRAAPVEVEHEHHHHPE
jgi:hypothetical protein